MNGIRQKLKKRDIRSIDNSTSIFTEGFYVSLETRPKMVLEKATGEGVEVIEGQRFVWVGVCNFPEYVLLGM